MTRSIDKKAMAYIKKTPRELLIYILITMLALPAPYLLKSINPAYAIEESSSSSESDLSPAELIQQGLFKKKQVFEEQIQGLDEILRGLRAGVHPLDIWGALSQRMVYHSKNTRGENIPHNNIQVVLGDYNFIPEALSQDDLKKYLSWIFDISDENFLSPEGELLPVVEGSDGTVRPVKPNTFEAESENSRMLHFMDLKMLDDREALHLAHEVSQRLGIRLDEATLFLEKAYNRHAEKNSPFARLFNKNLLFNDVNPNSSQVISAFDFKDSTQLHFNTENLMFKESIQFHPRKPTFSFINARSNKVFQEFTIPIKALFFYENYMVFVEEGSGYNSDSKVQYISFIDFKKYDTSVGHVGLPIFKIGLPSDEPIQDIRIENGKIKVGLINSGSNKMSDSILDVEEISRWSDLNEVAYNAHVNLVDPNHVAAGSSMIEGFANYQKDATEFLYKDITSNEPERVEQLSKAFGEHGKKLTEALSKNKDVLAEKLEDGSIKHNDFSDIAESLNEKDFANHLQIQTLQQTMIENGNVHHKMMRSYTEMWGFVTRLKNRAKRLSLQMQIPRPRGVNVLRNGLISISAHYNKNVKKDLEDGKYISSAQLLNHPYAKWGLRATLTALVAVTFPEQAAAFLYHLHSFGSSMFYGIFGFLGDMGYLAFEGFRQSLKYLNPFFLLPFIWENGLALSGAIAAVLTTWVVVPASIVQFVNSTLKLGKDLYDVNPIENNKGHRFKRMYRYIARALTNFNTDFEKVKTTTPDQPHKKSMRKKLVDNFIQQQRNLRKDYLSALSESAKKKQAQDENRENEKFKETQDVPKEDILRAHEIIKNINEEIQGSLDAKWWFKGPRKAYSAVKNSFKFVGKVVSYPYRKLKDKHEEKELTHLEESSADELANEKIKTFSGALLHFMLSWPSITLMLKNSAKYTWNSWFLFRSFFWHPFVFTKSIYYPKMVFKVTNPKGDTVIPSQFNGAKRDLLSQLWLWFVQTDKGEELAKWEDAIIPVEKEIHNAALHEALNSMSQFVKTQEDLMDVYKHGKIDHWSVGKVNRLHKKSQFFFKYYSQSLQEKATELYFIDYFKKHVEPNMEEGISEGDASSIKAMMEKSVSYINELAITADEAKYYIKKAAADKQILKDSKSLAEAMILNPKKFKEKFFNQNVLKQLNPKYNRQIERLFLVNRLLGDAGETARGVRFVVSNWKLNMPISIALSFLASAGLEGGAYQLVQNNPEGGESFMGFSKAVLIGMAFGLSLNVVGGADLWMQVQRNELNEGNFDKRLEGKQANMGLVPLWYEMTFKNPNNTFKKNYSHFINRIAIPNFKAALWNFIASYGAMWGRFDMGFFLMGYLTMFIMPMAVLDQQMDQGFELAISRYLATKFPPELLHLPEVQEFINKTSARYRDLYTLANKGYEELVAGPIGAMDIISTQEMGLRSFERTIFNGWSIAELAYQGIEELSYIARPIPGAVEVLSSCAEYLTNNMPAEMFQKTQIPPWIAK